MELVLLAGSKYKALPEPRDKNVANFARMWPARA